MKKLLKKQTNKINKVICNAAPGVFSDDYWNGKDIVLSALDNVCKAVGMDWSFEGCHYNHDDKDRPISKKWLFKVFDDQREGYGVIIASGAGTVSDPLSKYDIVSYISS